MQPIKCPHCGAPASPPPGVPMYTCPYCKQAFATNVAPPPQPAQAPQVQRIVVIAPGGGDDDDIADRVGNSISWFFRILIPLIILIAVLGSMGAFWFARSNAVASSFVWDGKTPFECGGNDDVAVKGVHAEFNSGVAITVEGNCHFTCTDCTIKSPTAIEAAGNGQVTIVNGTIEGTDVLADASGNARVNISGNVTASGQVKQSGNAKVNAPKPPPTASTVAAASTVAPTPPPKPTPTPTSTKKR